VARGVAGGELKPQEQQIPGDLVVHVDQFCVPATGCYLPAQLVEPIVDPAGRGQRRAGAVGLQRIDRVIRSSRSVATIPLSLSIEMRAPRCTEGHNGVSNVARGTSSSSVTELR
jgi:hypothetical protein